MDWIQLTSEEQIEDIRKKSVEKPQVIFKHSTRCGTSSWARNRLERSGPNEHIDFYFLDVIRNRPISRKVAEEFNVHHESPQVLIIRNGECVYDESHHAISLDEIVEFAA